MEQCTPFRILSQAEFLALPRADKLRYLARAIEAHKILLAQIAEGHGNGALTAGVPPAHAASPQA